MESARRPSPRVEPIGKATREVEAQIDFFSVFLQPINQGFGIEVGDGTDADGIHESWLMSLFSIVADWQPTLG